MLFLTQSTSPAEQEPFELVELIKSNGMKAACAISPQTPASQITDKLGEAVDMMLVMTVHPGRGGQKFMEECMSKVRQKMSPPLFKRRDAPVHANQRVARSSR